MNARLQPVQSGEVYTFESLASAEKAIANHVSTYQEASQALIDIREGELWREGEYPSWEEYLRLKWDFTPSRASQLEAAGRFVRYLAVSHPELPAPECERIVRAINQVPRKRRNVRPFDYLETEEQALERRSVAWREVIDVAESNGVDVTADLAAKIVQKSYRGGTKVKPKGWDTGRRLSSSFKAIAEAGIFPDKAAKLMTDSDWLRFDNALDFMRRMEKAR